MKKFALLFLVSALVFNGPLVFAQPTATTVTRTTDTRTTDGDRNSYFVLNGSYLLDYEDDNDHGFLLSGKAGVDLHQNMAFEVETGWSVRDYEPDDIDRGNIHMVPLIGNLVLKAPMNDSRWTPYASGGFGVAFWGADEEDSLGELDIDNLSLLFKIAAGVDYWVQENTAINFETGYFFVPDPDIEGQGMPEQEAGLDSWYIGAGVKFLFG